MQDGVPDACYEVKACRPVVLKVRCNWFYHLHLCLSCAVDRKVGDQTALLHDKDPFCRLTVSDSVSPCLRRVDQQRLHEALLHPTARVAETASVAVSL